MAAESPLVLDNIELQDLVQYVLDKHTTPSTLVACCSRDDFLKQLNMDVARDTLTAEKVTTEPSMSHKPRSPWSRPTLRLLASSQTVRIVFCPELAHLRAYLAAYANRHRNNEQTSLPTNHPAKPVALLAVFNPIALHRPTSAYSAQGINRTLAIAVEAAHHTHSQLILAECPSSDVPRVPDASATGGASETDLDTEPSTSPWDEEVSILNVTTKSFGAGERGWMGRTVSVRKIAGRWCRFVDRSGNNM